MIVDTVVSKYCDHLSLYVAPGMKCSRMRSACGAPTPIEWIFTFRQDGTTFVRVTNKGFPRSEAEAAQHALDSTEGFAFVLAGAKAFLEHNVKLNLVPDRS